MNIYKISQNIKSGYDTYDSAVVCAKNKEDAKDIHPSCYKEELAKGDDYDFTWIEDSEKQHIKVELIGKADESIKRGVIVASFNAG